MSNPGCFGNVLEGFLGKPVEPRKKGPWLVGYIGDDKLPSYIGILINHYKDPY